MLEQLDLTLVCPKTEYKNRLPALQRRLHQLQQACWAARLATVIVFEGWDAVGKGEIIRKLSERLEPRGFDLHSIVGPRSHERQLPWLYRFWVKLPRYGHMAIFDRSWYQEVVAGHVDGGMSASQRLRSYEDINAFERGLAEDRYKIIKFFLHIDKAEQGRRLEALQQDERTAWQVQPDDWQRHRLYDTYSVAVEEMLSRSEAEWAPWTLVEATDKRWARIKILRTVIDQLEAALRHHEASVPTPYDDAEITDSEDSEDVDSEDSDSVDSEDED